MKSLTERINEIVSQIRTDVQSLSADEYTLLDEGTELLESGEANAYKSILYLQAILHTKSDSIELNTLAEKLLANLFIEAVEKPEYELDMKFYNARTSYESAVDAYNSAINSIESAPTELALGEADMTLSILKDWMNYFKSESLYDQYYDCEERYNYLRAVMQLNANCCIF